MSQAASRLVGEALITFACAGRNSDSGLPGCTYMVSTHELRKSGATNNLALPNLAGKGLITKGGQAVIFRRFPFMISPVCVFEGID